MFKLMTIIVQTTRTNVTKQVIRNIATLSQFPISVHQLFLVWWNKLCLWDIPTKRSPWAWGLGNAQGIQWYPFVQSMCLEKLHRGELVHRDGSGEVLHLAESNSRRHHQTSLKFVDRQTPDAVKVSTFFLRHSIYIYCKGLLTLSTFLYGYNYRVITVLLYFSQFENNNLMKSFPASFVQAVRNVTHERILPKAEVPIQDEQAVCAGLTAS